MEISKIAPSLVAYGAAAPATTAGMTVAAAMSALKKKPNVMVEISDTSANISKNLDALKSVIDKISAIRQSGTTTALNLTAASVVSNANVLNKISNAYTLSITGTISEINQMSTDTHIAYISISDSSSNVASSLSTLKEYGNKLKTIALKDGNNLSLTAEQINTYSAEIAKIKSTNKIDATNIAVSQINTILANKNVATVSIIDNSTNIANALDTLQKIASKIKTTSISGDSNLLAISTKQFTSDKVILGKIISGYQLALSRALVTDALKYKNDVHLSSVSIVDSSANIEKNLDALNQMADKVGSITQSGKPTALNITVNQVTADSAVLEKINSTYSLSITGDASGIAAFSNDTRVASVSIIDSYENVIKNITNISNLDKNKIKSIDASVSALDYASASTTLGKITSNYSMRILDYETHLKKYANKLKSMPHVVSVKSTSSFVKSIITYQTGKSTNIPLAFGIVNPSMQLSASIPSSANSYNFSILKAMTTTGGATVTVGDSWTTENTSGLDRLLTSGAGGYQSVIWTPAGGNGLGKNGAVLIQPDGKLIKIIDGADVEIGTSYVSGDALYIGLNNQAPNGAWNSTTIDKYGLDGNKLNTMSVARAYEDDIYGIGEDSQGNLYMSSTAMGGGPVELTKFSSNGDLLWTKNLGDYVNWNYRGTAQMSIYNDKIFLAGESPASGGYLMQINTDGEMQWRTKIDDGLILISKIVANQSGCVVVSSNKASGNITIFDNQGAVVSESSPDSALPPAYGITSKSTGGFYIFGMRYDEIADATFLNVYGYDEKNMQNSSTRIDLFKGGNTQLFIDGNVDNNGNLNLLGWCAGEPSFIAVLPEGQSYIFKMQLSGL